MSARMLAVLRCDHDGCDQRFAWSRTDQTWKPPGLTDTRQRARAEGWTFGVRPRSDSGPAPTVDFCPEHARDIAGDGIAEVTP